MATSSLLLPSPASGQQSCCFFFHRHSSSRRLVRNERACTWKGPSGRVEPQGRFIGEPSSTSARPFGSRAQRRTARRRASIVGVFSSPESLGPPRRLLSPSADEAREAYNHGRAPAGAPRHSQDVRREELERLEPGRGCRARQVRSPPPVAISNTLLVFFWGLRAPASLRLPARRRPIGRSRVRPKRSPSIERTRRQEIHGNRWALVAAELPGKTGQQCAQRWRHKVNPAIKKEKWTPEEDAQVSNPLSSSSVRARDVGPIGGRVGFLAPEAASAPCATARATEEPPRPRAPAQILSPSFSPEPSKLTDAFFGVRNSSKQPLKNHGRRPRLRRPASDD